MYFYQTEEQILPVLLLKSEGLSGVRMYAWMQKSEMDCLRFPTRRRTPASKKGSRISQPPPEHEETRDLQWHI